jgi:hypothetical protein
MRLLAIQQDPEVRPVMHKKPQLGAKDHISMYDRGIISADSLCPELSNAVSIERLATTECVVTYHGSVNYVIEGTIPAEMTSEW